VAFPHHAINERYSASDCLTIPHAVDAPAQSPSPVGVLVVYEAPKTFLQNGPAQCRSPSSATCTSHIFSDAAPYPIRQRPLISWVFQSLTS